MPRRRAIAIRVEGDRNVQISHERYGLHCDDIGEERGVAQIAQQGFRRCASERLTVEALGDRAAAPAGGSLAGHPGQQERSENQTGYVMPVRDAWNEAGDVRSTPPVNDCFIS